MQCVGCPPTHHCKYRAVSPQATLYNTGNLCGRAHAYTTPALVMYQVLIASACAQREQDAGQDAGGRYRTFKLHQAVITTLENGDGHHPFLHNIRRENAGGLSCKWNSLTSLYTYTYATGRSPSVCAGSVSGRGLIPKHRQYPHTWLKPTYYLTYGISSDVSGILEPR